MRSISTTSWNLKPRNFRNAHISLHFVAASILFFLEKASGYQQKKSLLKRSLQFSTSAPTPADTASSTTDLSFAPTETVQVTSTKTNSPTTSQFPTAALSPTIAPATTAAPTTKLSHKGGTHNSAGLMVDGASILYFLVPAAWFLFY